MNQKDLGLSFIRPDWPAPDCVQALCTTRKGGSSRAPFDSFNLAQHVNDRPEDVAANRGLLASSLNLECGRFRWLNQVHGSAIVVVEASVDGDEADGSTATVRERVCLIMTADCLPVLLCDRRGARVAAVHAGWRGLAGGILDNAVTLFERPGEVMAWLGPAIGPTRFEVGEDVRERFLAVSPELGDAFKAQAGVAGKYLANLYEIARKQLALKGVKQVYGGDFCTFNEAERFYSYRRDGARSGRMASLIYLT